MSRTHQYRKVMKPMLERKRRARINKCLDELKDLMVHALQTEGESITKLEKADVLELTVRHLKKLHQHKMLTLNPGMEQDTFKTGYGAAAAEVSRCLTATGPGVDITIRSKLMNHLGQRLSTMPQDTPLQHHHQPQLSVRVPVPTYPAPVSRLSPPASLINTSDSDLGYNSGRDSTPSPQQSSSSSSSLSSLSVSPQEAENVWRPF